MMTTADDVAAYILRKSGEMTAMKLQKLVYYCQAWSLVWDERPLFGQPIQAWANGPVVRSLYDHHRGQFRVKEWEWGTAKVLDAEQSATVDAVLGFYGGMSAHALSELTHSEAPWRDARKGIPVGTRSNTVITDASMMEYYDGLTRAANT